MTQNDGWKHCLGPQTLWQLHDTILTQIEKILEIRVVTEYQILERVNQEISGMNTAVDGLMQPTRSSRGKLQPEPHPLGDTVRDTVMSGILRQLCDVVQQEFVASKEQYTALKQGLDEFREAAGKLRQSRPAPEEQLEELDATYLTALRRCQNAKDVYDARCKSFNQHQNGSPRKRTLIKQPKHLRNASTASLLSLDDPDINTADHDYRKAIMSANNLRARRTSQYDVGYNIASSLTLTCLNLIKQTLVSHSQASTQRATAQARHFAKFENALSAWSLDVDVPRLCSYISQERELIPPLVLRHDFTLGWMKRVVFCVPFSHLQFGLDSVPDIVKVCIKRCITVLEGGQWDAAEVYKFASVPKLSTARFEGVIVGIEQMDDMAAAIGTVEEALGVLNYLFFSLPFPFLRLNETVIANPEGIKTWWQDPSDSRPIDLLFKLGSMDVLSERILKYLLEEISNILHAAMDLHIVDVAMTWARPFFQKPQPSNAETMAMSVLFRRALMMSKNDPRWMAIWSSQATAATLRPRRTGLRHNSSSTIPKTHSRSTSTAGVAANASAPVTRASTPQGPSKSSTLKRSLI